MRRDNNKDMRKLITDSEGRYIIEKYGTIYKMLESWGKQLSDLPDGKECFILDLSYSQTREEWDSELSYGDGDSYFYGEDDYDNEDSYDFDPAINAEIAAAKIADAAAAAARGEVWEDDENEYCVSQFKCETVEDMLDRCEYFIPAAWSTKMVEFIAYD